jgi:hypothetical protein
MIHPLCRFVTTYSPRRPSTQPRCASVSPTRSRARQTQRGGRNLGLRYQQLESSVRSNARKVALLGEMADGSRLIEQHHSPSAASESRTPGEKVETFHGLVIPQEPKPPESDGELFTLLSALSLILGLMGLAPRMLHVRMCCLRL